jgi:hypothetical protein
MLARLYANWVYGGALAGLLLAALSPLIVGGWPAYLVAAWIQLPLYMIHQYEEHDADRFRRFVNSNVAGGREALTLYDVFIINVPGVWGVIAVSCYLAAIVRPGLALIAIYLTLVNAVAHTGALIALRRYNPGLITALIGFFPVGIWAWLQVAAAGASLADHLIGLAAAIGIHVAIILHVLQRPGVAQGSH